MSIFELITNFDFNDKSKFLQWVCGQIVHDSLGRKFHRINMHYSVLIDFDGRPYVYNNDDVLRIIGKEVYMRVYRTRKG